MKRLTLASLTAAFLSLTPAVAEEADISIDMRAVEELAGAKAAASFSATLPVPAAPDAAEQSLFAPLDEATGQDGVLRGESLQVLYARGSLVISPSAKETLDSWIAAFLKPEAKVEILSYSGAMAADWQALGTSPGNDFVTYSLHEAIRTAFKRALVIRDILIERGIPEDHITLRALGPAQDQSPPERIEVIALGTSAP